jgi:hypothetical protein
MAALNTFQPVILMSYATVTKLPTSEQEADRLHISPVLVLLVNKGAVRASRQSQTSLFHCEASRVMSGASDLQLL